MNKALTRRSFLKRSGVAVAGAGVLGLACCSEGGSGQGGGDGSGSIRVVMAQYSDATQDFWTKVVEDFEEQNPDISVQLEVTDWNTLLEQVPTWTQTQNLPDVLNFNAYSQFASQELLHPLSEVSSQSLRDSLIDTLAKNGEFQGTPYAIPLLASVRSLGYNKNIFSELGVSEPPTTWDELVTIAQAAKEAGYTGYSLPLGSEEAQGEWSLWAWSNGGGWKQGDEWTIDSDKNLETLNFLRTLANDHEVTQPNSGKTNRTDGSWQAFAQGDVAMTAIMPHGTFESSSMEGSDVEWDSVPFPRENTEIPEFTLGVTDYLVAFKNSSNTGAIQKFMSFVFEKDRYLEFIQNEGFLPTTKSASEEMADDPVTGQGIELLPKARFFPATDPAWNQVQNQVQSQLGTAMDPGTDPESVLAELQQVAEEEG